MIIKRIQTCSVSFRGVLICLIFVCGMIPLIIGGNITISSMEQNRINARMAEVQNRCQILSGKMTRSGYFSQDANNAILNNEIDAIADVYDARIMIVNKDFRIIHDSFKLSENYLHVAEEVIRSFQGKTTIKLNQAENYFTYVVPTLDTTEDKGILGVVVMTASTEDILDFIEDMSTRVLMIEVIFGCFLLVIAVFLAKYLLGPFKRLQDRLSQVALGALDTEILTKRYWETRELSQSVEMTLSKVKEMDQSRQEFVSNVSHELKTPITSIRVLADSLIGMEEAPVELYQEFMSDISDEIDRESKIIDDLLTLVKMDKSEAEVNITQVEINGLIEQILKRLNPIANKQKIELIYESMREVTADIDEMKFSLAVSNLVQNAIKYNMEDGWVRVILDADHKFFYVKVVDSGIGISEEFQEYIFERFYRVDKARSRETGGTGLGLSIARKVVLLHKGAIKVSSKEGEGSTFTIRIPLNYIV